MSRVRGRDVNIYVRVGSDWLLAGCATSCTLTERTEVIPITTADSGRNDEYIGGAKNAELSLSGLVTIDQITQWQYEDWMDNVGEVIRVLYEMEDTNGSILSYDMSALVTEVGNNADASDFDLFDVSMIRSGVMTKSNTSGGGGTTEGLLDSDGNEILDSDSNSILTG